MLPRYRQHVAGNKQTTNMLPGNMLVVADNMLLVRATCCRTTCCHGKRGFTYTQTQVHSYHRTMILIIMGQCVANVQ